MLEWLTFLLHILEVPGSNLSQETGYPDWGFSWFSSVLPGNCRDSTLNQARTAFFHILSIWSFTYHPFIRCYIIWVTKKASLNEITNSYLSNKTLKWIQMWCFQELCNLRFSWHWTCRLFLGFDTMWYFRYVSSVLRNIGNRLQDHVVSQPKRPPSTFWGLVYCWN
jgi:hypothetical protein